MVLRERAEPVQRRDDGDPRALGERDQLRRRAGLDDRRCRRGAADARRSRSARPPRAPAPDRCRPRGGRRSPRGRASTSQFGTTLACCASLVTSISTGPGRPVPAMIERLGDDARDVVRVAHEVAVLRDRHRDADDVRLLERVGAEQRARHLPGERDERSAVHPRVGDRRDEVRRARSARADAHADAPRRARVALGRVPRALLVPAEHVVQLVGVLRQRVIERHDRAARDAEDRVHALADEAPRRGSARRCESGSGVGVGRLGV